MATARPFLTRLADAEGLQRYVEKTDRPGPSEIKGAKAQGAGTLFTFGPGPMGIAVQEVRGGTRIAIESVTPGSQAEAIGVPVGGLLVTVDGRKATGLRLAAVGKLLAGASRPCNGSVTIGQREL